MLSFGKSKSWNTRPAAAKYCAWFSNTGRMRERYCVFSAGAGVADFVG